MLTRKKGLARTCWGLDQSDLEARHFCSDWSRLDTDEYVLPRRVQAGSEAVSRLLAVHCKHALASAVGHAWAKAADQGDRDKITARLTAMPLAEALALSAQFQGDWYARPRRKSRFWPGRLMRRPPPHALDLEAIETIDRALSGLHRSGGLAGSPAELTRIAFHAALNPVAACPEAFSIAELLAVAAWLGLIHRGRRVVLPRFIASYWMMLTEDTGAPSRNWEPDAFLLARAGEAIGLRQLREDCLKVLQSRPIVIRPSPRTMFQRCLRTIAA